MGETTVRRYYEAIDAGDYERFADLLAPAVVHDRPDRTIEGRETLVGFMRDDRPEKDTKHEVLVVCRGRVAEENRGASRFVAEGRLLDADGDELFRFADAFALEDGKIAEIRTYTN